MFLRYRADGADDDTLYEIRFDKVPRKRGAIAEKLYSRAIGERRTWEQLKADAQSGGIEARVVALWLAMTAQHPMMRYEDLPDFDTGALALEYSKQEMRQVRAQIERNTTILEAEKAMQLEQMEIEIEQAPAGSDEPDPEPAVAEPVDAAGKDSTTSGEVLSSSETSTG